jgi:Lar family restriction alleviation protein
MSESKVNYVTLKNCPFCGWNEPMLAADVDGNFYVQCTDCGAMTEIYEREQDAIDAWNKRFQ